MYIKKKKLFENLFFAGCCVRCQCQENIRKTLVEVPLRAKQTQSVVASLLPGWEGGDGTKKQRNESEKGEQPVICVSSVGRSLQPFYRGSANKYFGPVGPMASLEGSLEIFFSGFFLSSGGGHYFWTVLALFLLYSFSV